MTITKRSVQTNIGQLTSPYMLLLGGNIRENNFAILQSHLLGGHVNVCFSNLKNTFLFTVVLIVMIQ